LKSIGLEAFADEQRQSVRLLMVHVENRERADRFREVEQLLTLEGPEAYELPAANASAGRRTSSISVSADQREANG